MKKLLTIILSSVILLLSAGCGNGQIPDPEPEGSVLVVGTTVWVTTVLPGTVEGLITDAEVDMESMETLRVSGFIDQRDFVFANDSKVASIDFSGSRVMAYEDYPADAIPSKAFYFNMNLELFKWPVGITSIGNESFNFCVYAGFGQTGNIIIPEGVIEIGEYAFMHNVSEGSLVLPSTLKTLADGAFWNCRIGSRLILPQGLETIGYAAFYFCKNLTGPLELPSTLTSLGSSAFWGTGINGHITFPESLETLPNTLFHVCPITSVTFHEKIRSIGVSAFYGTALSGDVVIPASVESIGWGAFFDTNLSGFYVKWSDPIEYTNDMLENGITVYVPQGRKSEYEVAEGWKEHPIAEYTELP